LEKKLADLNMETAELRYITDCRTCEQNVYICLRVVSAKFKSIADLIAELCQVKNKKN
jgi:hypothetical protein